jgi:GNAT superfamily N-acetyltransferase
MVVELVEAVPAALDEVRSLLRRANEQHRARLHPRAFGPYLAMVLDLEARSRDAVVLGIRRSGALVAAVTYFREAAAEGWGAAPGVAGLRAMAVDPEHRGRGLGAALVGAAVERAEADGADALALHTAEWLREAIRLYERCGFVRDQRHDLLASEIMGVPVAHDYVALAYRLDLDEASR